MICSASRKFELLKRPTHVLCIKGTEINEYSIVALNIYEDLEIQNEGFSLFLFN